MGLGGYRPGCRQSTQGSPPLPPSRGQTNAAATSTDEVRAPTSAVKRRSSVITPFSPSESVAATSQGTNLLAEPRRRASVGTMQASCDTDAARPPQPGVVQPGAVDDDDDDGTEAVILGDSLEGLLADSALGQSPAQERRLTAGGLPGGVRRVRPDSAPAAPCPSDPPRGVSAMPSFHVDVLPVVDRPGQLRVERGYAGLEEGRPSATGEPSAIDAEGAARPHGLHSVDPGARAAVPHQRVAQPSLPQGALQNQPVQRRRSSDGRGFADAAPTQDVCLLMDGQQEASAAAGKTSPPPPRRSSVLISAPPQAGESPSQPPVSVSHDWAVQYASNGVSTAGTPGAAIRRFSSLAAVPGQALPQPAIAKSFRVGGHASVGDAAIAPPRRMSLPFVAAARAVEHGPPRPLPPDMPGSWQPRSQHDLLARPQDPRLVWHDPADAQERPAPLDPSRLPPYMPRTGARRAPQVVPIVGEDGSSNSGYYSVLLCQASSKMGGRRSSM